MKFSCTQENLSHALSLVSRIANRNTDLPILQNVLITTNATGITLATTNLEIGLRMIVRGKVDSEGSFTVPAQLFANYVALLPGQRVDCVVDGKTLKVTCGKQSTVIRGEEATDFPVLPESDRTQGNSIKIAQFELGLAQTVIAASVDDTRPEIAGVRLAFAGDHITLAATDSYRLAEKTLPYPQQQSATTAVILPQRAAQELLRLLQSSSNEAEVTLYLSDTQIAGVTADWEFVSRVIEGRFPDYDQLIQKHSPTEVELNITEFMKAVKGAALFSKTGINDVIFEIKADTIIVRSANVQVGENETTIAAKVTGQPTSIVFNHRFVIDGLQQLQRQGATSAVLGMADGTSPGTLRAQDDESYHYIIMPIKE